MLKLLVWDHTLKSKDINGKVRPLINPLTTEDQSQSREMAC